MQEEDREGGRREGLTAEEDVVGDAREALDVEDAQEVRVLAVHVAHHGHRRLHLDESPLLLQSVRRGLAELDELFRGDLKAGVVGVGKHDREVVAASLTVFVILPPISPTLRSLLMRLSTLRAIAS